MPERSHSEMLVSPKEMESLRKGNRIYWKFGRSRELLSPLAPKVGVVMHEDLKIANILLNSSFNEHPRYIRLKLAEFGLARVKSNSEIHESHRFGKGTQLWRALEVLPMKTALETNALVHKVHWSEINDYNFGQTDFTIMRDINAAMITALKAAARGLSMCLRDRSLLNGWSINITPISTCVDELTAALYDGLRAAPNDDETPRKRMRSRNWSGEETRALLKSVKESRRLHQSPNWDSVSKKLFQKYGFDRASKSCEDRWGTLLKSYRAIRGHHMSTCVSNWEMDENDRVRNKLPQAFDMECYETMERILNAKAFEQPPRIVQMCADLPCSADCDEVLDDESDSEIAEIDTDSEDEGLSGESAASLESQAEVTSESHAPRTEKLCCETNPKSAGRKRSAAAAVLDEDSDLNARIASFVNKHIEDALEPLISVLRNREEDEQKHREKMLAIEEEKLALMRQKLQFTRRVLARSNAVRPVQRSAVFCKTRMT